MTQTTTERFIPWWASNGCPTWCRGHDSSDQSASGSDRIHFSEEEEFDVTLEDPVEWDKEVWGPDRRGVYLWQVEGASEPQVRISGELVETRLCLTLDEAEGIIEALTGAVAKARGTLS